MTNKVNRRKAEDTLMEPANKRDLPEILTLLTRSKLPQDGLADHVATTIVAKHNGHVVGSAALELYRADALLRSVAVKDTLRGQGLGKRLTNAALALARRHKTKTVFLLTETAGEYFSQFGFKPVQRSEVPRAVQRSVEFTSACPASALVMMLRLRKNREGGVQTGDLPITDEHY